METSELIKNIKKSRLSKSEKELYRIFENSIIIPNKKENIDEYVSNTIIFSKYNRYIQIKHNKKVIYFNRMLFMFVEYDVCYDTNAMGIIIKKYLSKYNDYEIYSKYF